MNRTIIYQNVNVPIQISIIKLNEIYTNFEDKIKLLYILEGKILFNLINEKYELRENDFILINSFETVNITNRDLNNVTILEISISTTVINKFYEGFMYMNFKCISESTDKNKVINYIYKLLELIQQTKKNKELLIMEIIMNLCVFLIDNCLVETNRNKNLFSKRDRFLKIFNFLENNYQDENISTYDIADSVELSKTYLLKIFKNDLGISLKDYLNYLRLSKSTNDLLNTNKSIIEIAIDNGFDNRTTYHALFKKQYEMSPGEYRKTFLKAPSVKEDYFTDVKALKEKIGRHLEIPLKSNVEAISLNSNVKFVEIDLKKIEKEKINKNWSKYVSLGRISNGFNKDIRNQIKLIAQQFNSKYIKISELFETSMNFINVDDKGNLFYNYTYIDDVIDFILSTNMKPFINIGVTSKKIVSENKNIMIFNVDNAKLYKNEKIWYETISNLFNHFINKYGEEEISLWYFEIWNNFDSPSYWDKGEEAFYSFFKKTFFEIKNISKKIKIGGFSSSVSNDLNLFNNFISFLERESIKIDFFSIHIYEVEHPISDEYIFSDSENIKKIVKILNDKYNNNIEIIASEWNLTSDFINPVHDGCYKAAYIIDYILKYSNYINGLIYWTTVDRFELDLFHGGTGLVTSNYVKKASYNAFLLLNKMGDYKIAQGENYCITSNEEAIQVLLYNYKNRDFYNLKISNKEYYEKLSIQNKDIKLMLDLNHIESGKYYIKKYYLNKNSGSTYDFWLKMNKPKRVSEEILSLIKSKELMDIKIEELDLDNKLKIEENIKECEIVFYEIKKL